jgi:hypothetical protein
MDTVLTAINYILDYLTAVPGESWYVLGSILGSSSLVIGVVAWIKRRNLKKYGEALRTQFIALNVVFWSTISTVVSFILTNGTTFASFLPFLGTHMPQIIALSTVLYQISKPLKEWWTDRKNNKPIANHLPDLTPAVEAVTTPVRSKFIDSVRERQKTAPSSDTLL